MMNLRKLEHLLAVLESRNLRVASAAVNLSQPALSRSLASLENELGIVLLDRAYGKVLPTAHSQQVLEHIRKLVAETRALKDSVRRIRGLEEGEIRVGFGSFSAAIALRTVVSNIVERYPKLSLQIELASAPLMLELLRVGQLDIAICDPDYAIDQSALQLQQLPKQMTTFAVGPEHPLLKLRKPVLADLKKYPICGPSLMIDMTAAFRAHGFDRIPTVTCNDLQVSLDLARRTTLVAMVPQIILKTSLIEGLVHLPVEFPFDAYAYPCVITHGRTLGPAASLLVKLVSEAFSTGRSDKPLTGRSRKSAKRN